MEDRERRLEVGGAQVGVEGREPLRAEERLVGDDREAARGHVHGSPGLSRRGVDAPPHPVGQSIRLRGIHAVRPPQDRLDDPRGGRPRVVAERVGVHRHPPPPPDAEPLGGSRLLHHGADRPPGAAVADEDDGDPGQIRVAEGGPELAREHAPRDRQEHPRPVAGRLVGRDRAAMAQVLERLQGEIDHASARTASRARDKADAACVAFGSPVGSGVPDPGGDVSITIVHLSHSRSTKEHRRRLRLPGCVLHVNAALRRAATS